MGLRNSSLEICLILVLVLSQHHSVTHLLLSIGPSWNLNNHVQDRLLLVGVEGDVMEGRDGLAILLDVASIVKSVWLPYGTWGIL